MKTIFRFLKPYGKLCVFTVLVMILDVAGGLFVPRLTADMINIGVESRDLSYMFEKGAAMLVVTLIAGAGCARISLRSWGVICAMRSMRSHWSCPNMILNSLARAP